MTLIGLDLNSTRARAVHGPAPHVPTGLPLEGDHRELPLALNLEGRRPVVGRAGVALCRKLPHFACLDFLPHLGGGLTWSAGRHRLDAAQALALVFDVLQRSFGKAQGVALTLPAYLSEEQRVALVRLAEKARWRVLGSVPASLAAALAAHDHLPWSGLALVADVDGHALTWSAVAVRSDQVQLLEAQALPRLARGAWLGRLLNGVATRCVRESRRDPRESADAEQSLYDQLIQVLEAPADGGLVRLTVETDQWYQRLMVHPDELAGFCAPLVRQALAEMQAFQAATAGQGSVGAVLLTAAAARLPGLLAALEQALEAPEAARTADDDFGEGLLDEGGAPARLHALEADALARSAHDLAARLYRGDLPHGHLGAVPLPGGAAPDAAGPARLHFRGQDHPLHKPTFTLGRDPGCDLVFESELYPTVSVRHCEIVYDRGAYLLRDRSRHGTLVNDRFITQPAALRSGDWIQLGPSGPLLRFLGAAAGQQELMPTA